MGEKGVGKLSRETPPPREGEPMGAVNQSKTDDFTGDLAARITLWSLASSLHHCRI